MKSEKTTRMRLQFNPFLDRRSLALPLLALLSITDVSAQQVTLLDDNFTSAVRVESPANVFTGVDWDGLSPIVNDYVAAFNNRTVQQASTHALAPRVASSGGINGNSLAIDSAALAYSLSRYFPATELGGGDSITVSLNVRSSVAPTTLAATFRIGLFDSNGGGNLSRNNNSLGSVPAS